MRFRATKHSWPAFQAAYGWSLIRLVPLMRALDMPRPRLLLADGVGLGKTDPGGFDRGRTYRAAARAANFDRRALRSIAVAMGAGDQAAFRSEIHCCSRARRSCGRCAARTNSAPIHSMPCRFCITALDFAQTGSRPRGAGAVHVGPCDHRRSASLRRVYGRPCPRKTHIVGGWPRYWRGNPTECCF